MIAGAQTDTATTNFDVNGLNVILRRNTANDVVAANVYLLGGTQQLTPATQGIEAFLLEASERGTKLNAGEECMGICQTSYQYSNVTISIVSAGDMRLIKIKWHNRSCS